ncbi:COR domain-containing protein [uncultured Microscilla sp.]|uniref:leucine-rich repeat domain-containing protein n=1 Tax=uncultured Microscilla sp. TaxID=432653 RepID=UPI002637019A|nr:COR domain-containing protein [uncultured Microscilla sp.]
MSDLAKQLINENLATKNPVLDLGNCGLDGTEPVLKRLAECDHLETLILSNEWVGFGHTPQKSNNQQKANDLKQLPKFLPAYLKELVAGGYGDLWGIDDLQTLTGLTQLQALNLSSNHISDIKVLANFPTIEKLNLSQNTIADLSHLAGLEDLKTLNLNWNQALDLDTLPSLPNLTTLYLNSCRLTNIQALKQYKKIKSIYLRSNQLTNLSPLAGLRALVHLRLDENHIEDLSPLASLQALEALFLNKNRIEDLAPLAGLVTLRKLYLNENKITSLDPLAKLPKLTILGVADNQIQNVRALHSLLQLDRLDLSQNQIMDVNPLHNLTKLTGLVLGVNQIQNIRPLAGLIKLKILVLANNQITELPVHFFDKLHKLLVLELENNPIQNIPQELFETYNIGIQKLKDYLHSIARQDDQRELNEAKLIFVGVGEVGKTELAEAMSTPGYRFVGGRATTKGIQIKQWKPEGCIREGKPIDFTANIWDFAGQEINYGTHQFFLTKNSVYVFVWETRKGEDKSEFNYWLNIVSLLSDNAPVLVVQNKVDVYKGQINQQNWQKAFPNIVDFHETSCKTGEGMDALREMATKELLKLPNTREIWNKDRFAVRQALEAMTEDYISHRQYLRISEKHGLSREAAGFLAEQLHDIGVILHFGDDLSLKNTVVLKPEWATEAAYRLLDSQVVAEGKFHEAQLDDIWQDERFDDKHAFLLRIMERFELIFNLDNQGNYIVPELLPAQQPLNLPDYTVLQATAPRLLRFEYHYKFMPKGIMSRFICRIHPYIIEHLFWRDGVVLQIEQSSAIVTLNDALATKQIALEVWGVDADKLLYTIRSHFEHIHGELNHPPLDEKIPCYCEECQQPDQPAHTFRKKSLEKNLKAGIPKLVCDHDSVVSIKRLLEGILDVNRQHIKEFQRLIDQGNLAGFFAKIDDLGIEDYQVAAFRKKFISDHTEHNFDQQLQVWVTNFFRTR